MAQRKVNEFNDSEIKLAEIAKALSHPARIKILQILAEKNTCICGEIVDILPLSQATVSQHLKELKKVGLIKGQIEGPRVCYCINQSLLDEMSEEFNGFLKSLINQ